MGIIRLLKRSVCIPNEDDDDNDDLNESVFFVSNEFL